MMEENEVMEENTEMIIEVRKGTEVLLAHPLSRFNTNENNLSVCLKSVVMFEIPFIFNGVYDVRIILPGQVIDKTCMYLSYNYIVFSNTTTNTEGVKETRLDCSDNSLLFKILS